MIRILLDENLLVLIHTVMATPKERYRLTEISAIQWIFENYGIHDDPEDYVFAPSFIAKDQELNETYVIIVRR